MLSHNERDLKSFALQEKRREKEQEGVPDDEGWVTVTRHGKNKGAPRTEAQEQRVTEKEKKKRKEKARILFLAGFGSTLNIPL